jgi:hypothetical protein
VRNKACRNWDRPLMKIDYYGDVLVGCIECNRWGHPGNKKLTLETLDDDLQALRACASKKHRRCERQ